MEDITKIHPGDQITALGITATVWSILYQDHCGGTYDVEFIDDQDRYHHWKECYDGGTVTRSGEPGTYYRETSGAYGMSMIARIRFRRNGIGCTATIIRRDTDIWLGSFRTGKDALQAIHRYDNTLTWKEM